MNLQHFEPNYSRCGIVDDWTLNLPGDFHAINFEGQLGTNTLGLNFFNKCLSKELEIDSYDGTVGYLPFVPHTTQVIGDSAVDRVGEKLSQLTGFENYFFGTTGTSICDALMCTGRKVYTLEGGFHGRGECEACSERMEYEDIYKHNWQSREILLYEPLMGGYGKIRQHPPEFYDFLRDNPGIIQVADEVQFGLFHTKQLFSYQEFALHPDAVLIGKALGQQVPVSAMVTNLDLVPNWSSTFSHYPIGLWAAGKVLDYYLEHLKEFKPRARLHEKYLRTAISSITGQYTVFGSSFSFQENPNYPQLCTQDNFLKKGVYIGNYHKGPVFKAHVPPAIPTAPFFKGIAALSESFEE